MKTEKASIATLAALAARLETAAAALPGVSGKKMFGCHALWAKENVFALVWKAGRIGVKLTEEKCFAELAAKVGAEPWKAGPMTMSHWLLLPEALSSKASELSKWVKLAHAQASDARPKPKTKPKPKPKAKAGSKSAKR